MTNPSPCPCSWPRILPLGLSRDFFVYLGFIVSGSVLSWERKWI